MQFPFLATDTAQGLPSFQAKLEFYFLSEEIVKHSIVHKNVDFRIKLGELEESVLTSLSLSFPICKM